MRNTTQLIFLALGLLQVAQAKIQGAEAPDFGTQVYPILKEHCLRCHAAPYTDARSGRLKKPKGGVRFDTLETLKKGYLDDEEQAKKLFVAGTPELSPLYTSTALPADHDDIMPASGDPLTPEQQNVIKNWILGGAQFKGFEFPNYTNPKAKK